MFTFKNLSNPEPEEEKFDPEQYKVSFDDFLDVRRTAVRPHVFDLRTQEEYDVSHLPGAYPLPMEHFEDAIYQMPYEGDILLYGGGNQEARQAVEILYENGFDTFSYIDDYKELLQALSQSKFTITDTAQAQIKKNLQESDPPLKGFRIVAKPISPKKARYSIDFVKEGDDLSADTMFQVEGIEVYADADNLLFLEDTIIDYDATSEEGLSIKNPDREVAPLNGSETEIMQQLLDEQINPMVVSHGGFVELIEIKDNRVYLEFGGGCKGCGMVNVTLKQGVEVIVQENIPGIEEILDVTDHANGTNPYYQPGK